MKNATSPADAAQEYICFMASQTFIGQGVTYKQAHQTVQAFKASPFCLAHTIIGSL